SNKTIRAALALSLAAALPVSAVLTPAPAVAAEGDLDRAVTALRGIST
ncbi:MAG TPA: cell envelope biogenesis protein LolA, partial [Erythrobacter sp.]|nr:cell envelope biogenesis protein LolA [Erythrobacter sp.]